MRRLSLRLRLALASAGGVLVVSSFAGFVQYKLLTDSMLDRADAQLQRVMSVTGMLRPLGQYLDIGPLLAQVSEGQPIIRQVVDGEGRVLDSVGGRGLPVPDRVKNLAAGPGRDILYTQEFGGLRFRVLARHLDEGQILLVARPIEDVIEFQRNVVGFLVAQTVLTTLLAGIIGYLVTRQAIRPVQRTADTAADIASTGDLGKRIDAPTADRDLRRLTGTVNAMLDRIEDAYARQGEALEAERRFVADASHELRTPLTTIRGNIDYLGRTGADGDAITDLRQAAERLEKLVANLTQLARDDAGVIAEGQLLDFDGLVHDVLREPEYAGMTCRTDIADDLWVLGSEASLAAVVRNLVGNAKKYGRGRVEIEAHHDDGQVVFEVRDDGPGIAAGDLDRAFDRFWRSADAKGRPGSGLGLSIVRSAVRSHGGSVQAFPGPGGRFRVTLPAANAPVREPDDAGTEPASRLNGSAEAQERSDRGEHSAHRGTSTRAR